jgi:hypothetical protein
MTKTFLFVAAAALALSATAAAAQNRAQVNSVRYINQSSYYAHAYEPRGVYAVSDMYAYGPRLAAGQERQSWFEHNDAYRLSIAGQ